MGDSEDVVALDEVIVIGKRNSDKFFELATGVLGSRPSPGNRPKPKPPKPPEPPQDPEPPVVVAISPNLPYKNKLDCKALQGGGKFADTVERDRRRNFAFFQGALGGFVPKVAAIGVGAVFGFVTKSTNIGVTVGATSDVLMESLGSGLAEVLNFDQQQDVEDFRSSCRANGNYQTDSTFP